MPKFLLDLLNSESVNHEILWVECCDGWSTCKRREPLTLWSIAIPRYYCYREMRTIKCHHYHKLCTVWHYVHNKVVPRWIVLLQIKDENSGSCFVFQSAKYIIKFFNQTNLMFIFLCFWSQKLPSAKNILLLLLY